MRYCVSVSWPGIIDCTQSSTEQRRSVSMETMEQTRSPVCLPVCVFVFISVCPNPVCISVCPLSICLLVSFYLTLYLPVSPVYVCLPLSVCLSVSPVWLSFRLDPSLLTDLLQSRGSRLSRDLVNVRTWLPDAAAGLPDALHGPTQLYYTLHG